MQPVTKDDINKVINKHSLITDVDKLSHLDELIDDYIPWCEQLLERYQSMHKLCLVKDINGEITGSRALALSCFVVILYELETIRKDRGSEGLIKTIRRKSSETAGSYSVAYLADKSTSEFFGLIEDSPITYFINIALQACPKSMPVAWIPPCSNTSTIKKVCK